MFLRAARFFAYDWYAAGVQRGCPAATLMLWITVTPATPGCPEAMFLDAEYLPAWLAVGATVIALVLLAITLRYADHCARGGRERMGRQ